MKKIGQLCGFLTQHDSTYHHHSQKGKNIKGSKILLRRRNAAAPAAPATSADAPTSRRRVCLKPADFASHGFTAGCPGCIRLQQGGGIVRNHTEACRRRIETALEESAEGRNRKTRAHDRREEQLTEELLRKDAELHPPEQEVSAKDLEAEELIPEISTPAKHDIFTPAGSPKDTEEVTLQSGPFHHSDEVCLSC